ncbi:MAG: diaminopimelate decarboxylase [Pseudomonadota bacterium]|nr:diaminopimelate decarboxylase [Pseudomonadota bacterium]
MMDNTSFQYRDGTLYAESVSLNSVAEQCGTPVYVYSLSEIENRFNRFADAFQNQSVLVAYSVKANSNQAVIAALSGLGAGADVVSLGELRRALLAGVPGNRIVFSGVGKKGGELEAGLRAGVHQFNVESESQLKLLADVAGRVGVSARVAIRVNPDVDAGTHDKIATGRRADKFGVPVDEAFSLYQMAGALPGLNVVGVDLHIGSQLTELDPFRAAFSRLAELLIELRRAGHRITQIDLGGGLGVCYEDEHPPSVTAYAELIREVFARFDCQIIIEPGRAVVADSGVLLCRVIEVKGDGDHRFVVVDAAMNDLLRPALYDAWHAIEPVVESGENSSSQLVDVVGPVCESGDVLGRRRKLPQLVPGDLLVIRSVGAYGSVMASSYNTRPLAAEVLVYETKSSVIRPRQDLDTLIGQDRIPDWMPS